MTYQRHFIVGRTYLTREGRPVKIIAEGGLGGYGCWVQGDDGEDVYEDGELVSRASESGWRYDRPGDVGRCTGSGPNNPRNLVPGSEQGCEPVPLPIGMPTLWLGLGDSYARASSD